MVIGYKRSLRLGRLADGVGGSKPGLFLLTTLLGVGNFRRSSSGVWNFVKRWDRKKGIRTPRSRSVGGGGQRGGARGLGLLKTKWKTREGWEKKRLIFKNEFRGCREEGVMTTSGKGKVFTSLNNNDAEIEGNAKRKVRGIFSGPPIRGTNACGTRGLRNPQGHSLPNCGRRSLPH